MKPLEDGQRPPHGACLVKKYILHFKAGGWGWGRKEGNSDFCLLLFGEESILLNPRYLKFNEVSRFISVR